MCAGLPHARQSVHLVRAGRRLEVDWRGAGAGETRVVDEEREAVACCKFVCFAQQGRDFFAQSDVVLARSGVVDGWARRGRVSDVNG